MKQLTCAQLGGPCDAVITGSTTKEMMDNGMVHLNATHPEMAKDMAAMSKEDGAKWMAEFQKKWDATPDK